MNEFKRINWPAFWFSSHCQMVALDSEEFFTFGTTWDVKEMKEFKVNFLVDITGEKYALSNPKIEQKLSFKEKIFNIVIKSKYKIQWEVNHIETLSLAGLIELIKLDWDEYYDFYSEIYCFEEEQNKVLNAQSITELFEIYI